MLFCNIAVTELILLRVLPNDFSLSALKVTIPLFDDPELPNLSLLPNLSTLAAKRMYLHEFDD